MRTRAVAGAFGVVAALSLLLAPAAEAYYPQTRDMSRVDALSEELRAATQRLEELALEERHHYDAREENAIRQLADLSSRASLFARSVDRFGGNPERTEYDFQRLADAFAQARATRTDLHAYDNVQAQFDRVERLMGDLYGYYGGRESWWGGERSDAGRTPPARGRDHRGSRSVATRTVPAGTLVEVSLDHAIRSRDLDDGQEVPVTVASDVVVDSMVVIPRGTPASARVVELDKAGRVEGREELTFELASVRLDGRSHALDTNEVRFVAEGSKKRDFGTIGGGAAIGAIIGAITDGGDGAAKGAAAGAAAGTGVVLLTRGKTIHLPAGQRIAFRLDESARLPIDGLRAPEDRWYRPYRSDPGNVSHRRDD